jgi:hypothetical protein
VDTICAEDCVPTVAQYWRRRERTAGVYPVIATIPCADPTSNRDSGRILTSGRFIYGVDVSKQELTGELMGLLWRHTSYLVHM